jgi:hypothetical protein
MNDNNLINVLSFIIAFRCQHRLIFAPLFHSIVRCACLSAVDRVIILSILLVRLGSSITIIRDLMAITIQGIVLCHQEAETDTSLCFKPWTYVSIKHTRKCAVYSSLEIDTTLRWTSRLNRALPGLRLRGSWVEKRSQYRNQWYTCTAYS